MQFSPALADQLRASRYRLLVTGASGWLGQAMMEMLQDALGDAFDARVRAYNKKGGPLALRSGNVIDCAPLSALAEAAPAPSLLMHFAFLTRDKVSAMTLEQYIAANAEITNLVLSNALRIGVEGVFTPSSGAVYNAERVVDTDMERNPYGVMKHQDELAFAALGVPCVNPRLFNLAGPFINKVSSYALSSILLDLQAERPITLRATKPVWRSYVHVADLMSLGLSCLLNDRAPQAAFDTAGEETIEVGELATRAAAVLGRPDHPIVRPPFDTAVKDYYVGNAEPFRTLCRAENLTLRALDLQIRDTADYLAEAYPSRLQNL